MFAIKASFIKPTALAVLTSLAITPAAIAEETPDPNIGRAIAQAKCANCHSIEPGAKSSPELSAPPFAEMITEKKLTADQIEGWLAASHHKMPDIAIPTAGRADLAAYIKSLALTH